MPRPSKEKTRDVVVSLRLSAEEWSGLGAVAGAGEETAFIRGLILDHVGEWLGPQSYQHQEALAKVRNSVVRGLVNRAVQEGNTVASMARIAGMDRSCLSRFASGKADISPQALRRVAATMVEAIQELQRMPVAQVDAPAPNVLLEGASKESSAGECARASTRESHALSWADVTLPSSSAEKVGRWHIGELPAVKLTEAREPARAKKMLDGYIARVLEMQEQAQKHDAEVEKDIAEILQDLLASVLANLDPPTLEDLQERIRAIAKVRRDDRSGRRLLAGLLIKIGSALDALAEDRGDRAPRT